MRIILLCVLALFVAVARCSNACDPYIESHRYCTQDPKCRFHMYIDIHPDDMDSYREVVNYHPTARKHMEHIFCQPEDETHGEYLDLSRQMWIESTYETHGICKDVNEFYVRDIGCMCRHGKQCNPKNAANTVLGIDRHDLFIVLIAASLVGLTIYVVRALRPLTGAIDKANRKATAYDSGDSHHTLPSSQPLHILASGPPVSDSMFSHIDARR